MGYLELAIFVFVVVGWIIRTIYKFLKWSINQVKTVGVAPSPIQEAIAQAQRQQAAAALPSRPQVPLPQVSGPQVSGPQVAGPQVSGPQPRLRPLPPPRRPDAGGPAVPREATRADFDRSERELLTSEPAVRNSFLPSLASPEAVSLPLFQNTDDLVRAMILQEVLSPPLSRRSSSRQ